MTAIHTVGSRSLGTDSESTQSLVQHFYFIAAVAIVLALVLLRIIVLRRRNQALSNFFRIGSSSQYSYGSYPPHNTRHGALIHGIQLAPLPAAYRPDRRIRAADIDEHGRRLDGEEGDGKDVLPAYDNLERLPKYIEVGWSHGGPLPPTVQQSVAVPSPQEQSGTAHPNTTGEVPRDNAEQLVDDTHDVAGVIHGGAPTHTDSSRG
ncbi:hypothetical protein EV363DRAFT_1418831 [Boletus edulis]|nr:hypothetical protein EV363DRAFT_1418831 [Boletus edulis]